MISSSRRAGASERRTLQPPGHHAVPPDSRALRNSMRRAAGARRPSERGRRSLHGSWRDGEAYYSIMQPISCILPH